MFLQCSHGVVQPPPALWPRKKVRQPLWGMRGFQRLFGQGGHAKLLILQYCCIPAGPTNLSKTRHCILRHYLPKLRDCSEESWVGATSSCGRLSIRLFMPGGFDVVLTFFNDKGRSNLTDNQRAEVALECGKFIIAYSELDFRITSINKDLEQRISQSRSIFGKKAAKQDNATGASGQWKLLEKQFKEVCENDVVAVKKFVAIKEEEKPLFKMRSAIAHGIVMPALKEGCLGINVWKFKTDRELKIATDGHLTEVLWSSLLDVQIKAATAKRMHDDILALTTSYMVIFTSKALKASTITDLDRYNDQFPSFPYR